MSDKYFLGDSSAIPLDKCPKCGASGKHLKKLNENTDNMTEGELAEYVAGTWGRVKCGKCKKISDYNI